MGIVFSKILNDGMIKDLHALSKEQRMPELPCRYGKHTHHGIWSRKEHRKLAGLVSEKVPDISPNDPTSKTLSTNSTDEEIEAEGQVMFSEFFEKERQHELRSGQDDETPPIMKLMPSPIKADNRSGPGMNKPKKTGLPVDKRHKEHTADVPGSNVVGSQKILPAPASKYHHRHITSKPISSPATRPTTTSKSNTLKRNRTTISDSRPLGQSDLKRVDIHDELPKEQNSFNQNKNSATIVAKLEGSSSQEVDFDVSDSEVLMIESQDKMLPESKSRHVMRNPSSTEATTSTDGMSKMDQTAALDSACNQSGDLPKGTDKDSQEESSCPIDKATTSLVGRLGSSPDGKIVDIEYYFSRHTNKDSFKASGSIEALVRDILGQPQPDQSELLTNEAESAKFFQNLELLINKCYGVLKLNGASLILKDEPKNRLEVAEYELEPSKLFIKVEGLKDLEFKRFAKLIELKGKDGKGFVKCFRIKGPAIMSIGIEHAGKGQICLLVPES